MNAPAPVPLSIIVAVADNYAIGKDNQLLWHIPEDLKRFKAITLGHKLLMGKRTWESLPVKPLPGRESIVLTDVPGEEIEGAITVHSIAEALERCDLGSENFVIGGGSIYSQFLPLASKLYLTRVHAHFDADTFFPEPPADEWLLVNQQYVGIPDTVGLAYTFEEYLRR
ncbi:MAG TPA: dihydrofolate reductase [Bacteroidales bacterium]|nr:dihydrofolate reductase [Bacteroidales bacterium]HRZ76646.1 dihydrofolate reductase [Bacteroidales bacterium]